MHSTSQRTIFPSELKYIFQIKYISTATCTFQSIHRHQKAAGVDRHGPPDRGAGARHEVHHEARGGGLHRDELRKTQRLYDGTIAVIHIVLRAGPLALALMTQHHRRAPSPLPPVALL